MIVLDTNILIRAVLGNRVPRLLLAYGSGVQFLTPEFAFREAEQKLPLILEKRALALNHECVTLNAVSRIVGKIDESVYSPFEFAARRRLVRRDPNDWPILAAALAAGCPIWTEDKDFFGCGVATWTTDRIEIFLEDCVTRHHPGPAEPEV